MFGTLPESRARRERGTKGTVASVVAHAAVIALAVSATARATSAPPPPPDEQIVFVDRADPPPAPPVYAVEPPPPGPVAPDVVGSAPVLDIPSEVPTRIPDVDVTAHATDPSDFRHGARRAGELPAGTAIADAGTNERPLSDFQVDRPVRSKRGCAPRFPDILRSAGVEGEVLAQFTVDVEGRVVAESFRALRSSHDLFAQAVRSCLGAMRFVPAELQGRKVPQLVQQPFVFALERR